MDGGGVRPWRGRSRCCNRERVKGFAAAWAARDPDKLITYYSEDVRSYDALPTLDTAYTYSTIDSVLHQVYIHGIFDVKVDSFFVSDDGRFAATLGTFAEKRNNQFLPKPYVSLLQFDRDKIVWIFDYYGGPEREGLPLQKIPASASRPASNTQSVVDAKALITAWETAFNGKDARACLSFYADGVKYTPGGCPGMAGFHEGFPEPGHDSPVQPCGFQPEACEFLRLSGWPFRSGTGGLHGCRYS